MKYVQNILNWASFILNSGGALMIASNAGLEWQGYGILILASAVFGAIAYLYRNVALLLTAVVWVAIDIVGFIRWL